WNFNELPNDKTSGIYISSLSAKKKDLVVLCRSTPSYANGLLFYADDQNELRSLPIDSRGKVTGESKVEIGRVGRSPSTYRATVSVASNGTILHQEVSGTSTSQL